MKNLCPARPIGRKADKSPHSTEFTYSDYNVGWVFALSKEQVLTFCDLCIHTKDHGRNLVL
jgi:hypothetical protein